MAHLGLIHELCDQKLVQTHIADSLVEFPDGRAFFDGIPNGDNGLGEALLRLAQCLGQPCELIWGFKGRVDQDQSAFFRKGREGFQRFIPVAMVNVGLRFVAQRMAKRTHIVGVQLARNQAVLGPRAINGDPG